MVVKVITDQYMALRYTVLQASFTTPYSVIQDSRSSACGEKGRARPNATWHFETDMYVAMQWGHQKKRRERQFD